MLMAGCGNSRLSEDMFEDGFANISNVDISRVVIDQMGDKYKDKPALTFQQMNVCSLEFPDESFDAVIVKGTMDAILCGEGSTANVAKMCMEVSRVLKPSGILFVVSYGVPDNRMQYLENEDYSWTVTTHTVPKPTVSATAVPDTKDANSVHYIYVCAKGGNAEEGVLRFPFFREGTYAPRVDATPLRRRDAADRAGRGAVGDAGLAQRQVVAGARHERLRPVEADDAELAVPLGVEPALLLAGQDGLRT